jgi:hypothetical protein
MESHAAPAPVKVSRNNEQFERLGLEFVRQRLAASAIDRPPPTS